MLAVHLHGLLPRVFRGFSTRAVQNSGKTWRVSSLGRVCSSFGTVSYGCLHPSGYRLAFIQGRQWFVHRIVAITFNGPPPCEQAWQVHHVDGEKSNNCLNNLEYVTPRQNILYCHASPLRKNNASARSKPVTSRPAASEDLTWHPSIAEAARQLGVAQSTVLKSCRTNSPAKGYIFRYYESTKPCNPGEEWRPMLDPTSGAEVCGRMVSSLGRISSKLGIISTGHLNKMGYHQTGVTVNGQKRTIHVHRLVAAAFIGLPEAGCCVHVNHKDLDKGNNAAENLEYLTPAENATHFHALSSWVRTNGLKPVWIKAYGVDEPWRRHPSIKSAADALGLSPGCISQCAHGKAKRVGDYECRFADLTESHPIPGEEWRDVDILALQQHRQCRR